MSCLFAYLILPNSESKLDDKNNLKSKPVSRSQYKQSFELKMDWIIENEISLNEENVIEVLFESSLDQGIIKIQYQPTPGIEILNIHNRVILNNRQFKEKIDLKITANGRHYLSIIATSLKDNQQVFKTFSIPIVCGKLSKKKDRSTIDANGKRIFSLKAKSDIK